MQNAVYVYARIYFVLYSRKAAAMEAYKKLAGLKILLIDDNELVRDPLKMLFVNQKSAVKAVATAEEGLRKLEGDVFDAIICDYSLPGINGTEFFKRAVAACPNTVKILISGFADENAIAEALEMGVDAFLRKPFSAFALQELLTSLVGKYRAKNCNRQHPPEKKTALKINRTSSRREVNNSGPKGQALTSPQRGGVYLETSDGMMDC